MSADERVPGPARSAVDLLYALAKRARELSDEPMSALRRTYVREESYTGSPRDTRGQVVENVLLDEFEDTAKHIDEVSHD